MISVSNWPQKNADCVTLDSTMKRLDTLLNTPATSGLETLIQKAQNMDDLAHKLRKSLNPALAAELLAVNLRQEGELVVICSSPAWAARMRYEANALIKAAQLAGVEANECRFRVAHPV